MLSRPLAPAALVAALFAGRPLAAQRPDPRVDAAARTVVAADLMRDATYLAADALRGRATPSPGLDSAAAYVVRELTRLGVQPAGDGGGYRQHYTVATARLDTARTTATIAGRTLAWGAGFVVASFVHGGVRAGEVAYVGGGLRAPRLGIDPYAAIDVRGRWLLVHGVGLPAGVTPDRLGTRGVDYTTADDEARARGAIGIVRIAPPAMAASWERLRSRAPTVRELAPSVGRAFAPPPLPLLVLSRGGLATLLGARAPAVLAADSARRDEAPFVAPGTLRVDLVAETTTIRPYNVVGLIEGSDPRLKHEWISVSAHLDGAVGSAPNAAGDSVYNAADDNASGSAGTLAVARALLRGPRPKRSVLLVWDSGEETGLWGSRFLAYGPLAEPLVAHFTVDMIARTKRPGTNLPGEEELSGPGEVHAVGPKTLSTQMEAVLGRVARDYGYVRFDRRFDDPAHEFFYPRTDAAPYLERGIPYLEIFTGLHGDYHAPSDEVSKFDPAKFEAVARTIYVTLWTLADDPVRPRMDRPLPASLSFVRPR